MNASASQGAVKRDQLLSRGLMTAVRMLTNTLRLIRRRRALAALPLKGYQNGRVKTEFVERLADDDLAKLNSMLEWNAFTVDSRGRRFGGAAWGGKRDEPQSIPDRRIALMAESFNLADRNVLEVGCFEGIHTVALCQYAGHVTAVDARIENVVKTIVRCAMFGFHPTVFKFDLESQYDEYDRVAADFCHHVGVLYHLKDPIRHLYALGRVIREGIMLDTHYCDDEEATLRYEVGGHTYQYKRYQEFGEKEVFSGMYDHAKWLRLGDLVDVLKAAGFAKVQVLEKRAERNGPRVLLLAQKIY